MARDPAIVDGGVELSADLQTSYSDKYVVETKVGTERGLLPNTRYAVRTRAVNNLGVTSEWSDALEFDTSQDTTIPDDVKNANVTLDSSTGNITLRWDKVTTNEDGSPLLDFAFYEIVFEDPVSYPVYGVIPAFSYSSITESYTLLNSTNKAIHAPYGEGATLAWNVAIYATDYSGNRSEPTYINIDEDNWETYDPSGDPVTLQSNDYDGIGGVAANDASDGWRLEAGGLAEFNELRVNGDLEVDGHSSKYPAIAIYSRNEANSGSVSSSGRQEFTTSNWDTVTFNSAQLVGQVDGTSLVSYSAGIFTVNVSGMYRLAIQHRWEVAGPSTRHSQVQINAGTPKVLGGHSTYGTLATELNAYTDVRCFALSAGDTLIFRLMHDQQPAATIVEMIYAQVTIEWLSN
jgi:hypothetical protein